MLGQLKEGYLGYNRFSKNIYKTYIDRCGNELRQEW
jgi:hypothetical protein